MKLEEFYGADARRGPSGEVDFGVMWRGYSGGSWPSYRVSWIKATGEVYAVRQNREQDDVRVLGVVAERDILEAVLQGWADHTTDGIGWVRQQLVAAGFAEALPLDAAPELGNFSAEVIDSGGGQVRLLVDRDTLFYPAVGRKVWVILVRELAEVGDGIPF